MNALTEEQLLLSESVQRFVESEYTFAKRQTLSRSERGFSDSNWKTFAELGWLGLPFSEADGGFDGGAVESTIMMENFGRGLVVEPYLATVLLAGSAIKHAGSSEQKERLIPPIVAGEAHGALAFVESQSRFNLADVETTAARDGNGFVLNGAKSMVLNGPAADFVIVSARSAGNTRDLDGISLFVVDTATPGLGKREYPTVDGGRAAEVALDNVHVTADALLGDEGNGLATLKRATDEGLLAVCAEAVGCMEVLYKDTVEYCKNRKQFGQPIGKFQVLQHRMVDMFMEYEQSRSLLMMAAAHLDAGYDEGTRKVLSALKVQVGKSGRFVGQNAIQLHGGMGMTDELNIGHYFKRLTAIDVLFGNVDFHLRRFSAY